MTNLDEEFLEVEARRARRYIENDTDEIFRESRRERIALVILQGLVQKPNLGVLDAIEYSLEFADCFITSFDAARQKKI